MKLTNAFAASIIAISAGCAGPEVKIGAADQAAVIDATTARLANKTSVSNSRQHGPQASYASPDGRVFLWYPGNDTILEGEWKIRASPDFLRTRNPDGTSNITRRDRLQRGKTYGPAAEICYRYGENTFNPATKKKGGVWECVLASLHLSKPKKFADGDTLALARGGPVPYVTDRDVETYRNLVKQARAE